MISSTQFIEQAKNGFSKWLTLGNTSSYIMEERARLPGKPAQIYAAAFISNGYMKLDFNVIKMTKVMNEDGTLRDIELTVMNEKTPEPIKLLCSMFQMSENLPSHARFGRMFSNAKDRDDYFEDLKMTNELSMDYNLSYLNALRLGLIKKNQ